MVIFYIKPYCKTLCQLSDTLPPLKRTMNWRINGIWFKYLYLYYCYFKFWHMSSGVTWLLGSGATLIVGPPVADKQKKVVISFSAPHLAISCWRTKKGRQSLFSAPRIVLTIKKGRKVIVKKKERIPLFGAPSSEARRALSKVPRRHTLRHCIWAYLLHLLAVKVNSQLLVNYTKFSSPVGLQLL